MKQIQLIALLLAAAGLTACSSDEGTGTVEAPRLIIVDVTENPFTDSSSSAKKRVATRTAEFTTTESFDKFSMNYTQYYKFDFYKNNNGSWTNTNTWPSDVNVCDFYAYTGDMDNTEEPDDPQHIFHYNDGEPYIAFTVLDKDDNSQQHDLLVAVNEGVSRSNSDPYERVSLSFDHALAAVRFEVKITNTLSTQLAKQFGNDYLTVNSIVLNNVYNSGYYDYKNKSWTTKYDSSTSYTLTGSFDVTTEYNPLPCGYLFLIPQNRKVSIAVEYEYTPKGQTEKKVKVAEIPFTVEWESGYIYPIEIKLGTGTIKLD